MAHEVTSKVNPDGNGSMETFGFDEQIFMTKVEDLIKEVIKKAGQNDGNVKPSDFVEVIEENFSKRELCLLAIGQIFENSRNMASLDSSM